MLNTNSLQNQTHSYNGTLLPKNEAAAKGRGILTIHDTRHDFYSKVVKTEVMAIESAYNSGAISAKEAKTKIWKLQNSLKNKLAMADDSLFPNKGQLKGGCKKLRQHFIL